MVMELTGNHSAPIRSSARYETEHYIQWNITSEVTQCHQHFSTNAILNSCMTTYAAFFIFCIHIYIHTCVLSASSKNPLCYVMPACMYKSVDRSSVYILIFLTMSFMTLPLSMHDDQLKFRDFPPVSCMLKQGLSYYSNVPYRLSSCFTAMCI